MKYIIVPVIGCPLLDKNGIRECGHEEWTMNCSFNERGIYHTRFDDQYIDSETGNKIGRYEPSGIPIMFLRQYGMQEAAQELIDLANRP